MQNLASILGTLGNQLRNVDQATTRITVNYKYFVQTHRWVLLQNVASRNKNVTECNCY
jgi:hypothetical protein